MLQLLIKYNSFAGATLVGTWGFDLRLHHTFEVQAPVEEVWRLLLDIERVAPCLPGARLGDRVGDDAYDVGVTVKLGPMQMSYAGRLDVLERDAAAKRAVMRANVTEQRGQGTADATITTTLTAVEGGTRAESVTELRLTGRVAQMGGIVEDVSNRLLHQFSECLGAKAAAGPGGAASAAVEARPISALTLARQVMLDRLRRLLGRPRR